MADGGAKPIPRKPTRKINGEFRDITATMRQVQFAAPDGVADVRLFALNALRVLVTNDPPAGLLHLSISHPSRYPTWDEIAHARYTLLPADRTFAMLLPPPDQYVNIEGGRRSGNIFHLHELTPEEAADIQDDAQAPQPEGRGRE